MKTFLLFLLTSCTLHRDIQVHTTTGVVTEIKEGMRGNERVFFVTWKDSDNINYVEFLKDTSGYYLGLTSKILIR